MSCNHPSGTWTVLHPLRGILRRLKHKTSTKTSRREKINTCGKQILAIRFWKEISKFFRCWSRILLLALNKIIYNSHSKKKVNLEEQKTQKEGRFLRGRQIAFMIYDYFRVTGAHDAVLDYADLCSVNLHNNDIQDFDTRWVYVKDFHPMTSWKVCAN